MEKTLTIAEIESQFDSEWVLVEDPLTNESLEVQGGKVLYHSKDRDEFDRIMLEFHPKRSAVLFTGEASKDLEFVL